MKTCNLCKENSAGCQGLCVRSDSMENPFPTVRMKEIIKELQKQPLKFEPNPSRFNNYGWICPVCGAGMSPYANRCGCISSANPIGNSSSVQFWDTSKINRPTAGMNKDTGDFRDRATEQQSRSNGRA